MGHSRENTTGAGVVWAGAALLLVVITGARFAVPNPVEAIGFLYVLPVCITAAELGRRAGLVVAVAAMGCIVSWIAVRHLHLGVVGFVSRATALLGVGLIVGWQREVRRHLERERERLIDELRALAMEDQLTGLPNRRAWDQRLRTELARGARAGTAVTIAAIDLDRLKEVNDTQGHEAGDLLLKSCAATWASELRGVDFLARVGGDEFALLLTDCDADAARGVADRLMEGMGGDNTASVGVAEWDGEATALDLMRRADRALYDAKRAGRGLVAVEPAPSPAR
jgi:diguanylate cyclase (GGDEF)-like protein